MNQYVVLLQEKKRGSLTAELLEQHVHHLQSLTKIGALSLCGPFKSSDGAIQILRADTYAQAEAYIKSDPFIRSGYYAKYCLWELEEANEANHYLMESTNV